MEKSKWHTEKTVKNPPKKNDNKTDKEKAPKKFVIYILNLLMHNYDGNLLSLRFSFEWAS